MSLPICEICHEQKASILICLEHDGETEKHHICIDCVGDIADTELAGVLNHKSLDYSKLKSILHQMQDWHEPKDEEMVDEEVATFQKLQAMMGDDADLSLDELAEQTMETALFGHDVTPKTEKALSCSHCGTSWKNIHKDGLVGCPHCYVTFAMPLEKVMGQLHSSSQHSGKIPRFLQKQQRLQENQEKRERHRLEMLERRLNVAIQSENYEEAAQIREKIDQVSNTIVRNNQNT